MRKISHWILNFFFLMSIICIQSIALYGHSYRVPLIVDTDMGLDDIRGLILLLNNDLCDIRLIVVSDGAASTEKGKQNLIQLLKDWNRTDIPVTAGRTLSLPDPEWRYWTETIFDPELSRSATSSSSSSTPSSASSTDINSLSLDIHADSTITRILKNSSEPCLYLCLGPLTNLSDALTQAPELKEKISRVIYYGNAPNAQSPGWNTSRDTESAKKIFFSGLQIHMMTASIKKEIVFDRGFLGKIMELNSPASRYLAKIHKLPQIAQLLEKNHFKIWDEMAVIYLNNPELFQMKSMDGTHFESVGYDERGILEAYLKLAGISADSHLKEREIVVLEPFPVDPLQFKPDVQPWVQKIRERHGMEEWKACVITNELHRHLGIYSIIGAKMGIRARELLDAPLDTLEVISFTGLKPPLSCLNDGLQVSTGASLGRGTIQIANTPLSPSATFSYHGQKITLKIKKDLIQAIQKDIQKGIDLYGELSKEYFNYVRQLSLRYWFEMDRSLIFDQIE